MSGSVVHKPSYYPLHSYLFQAVGGYPIEPLELPFKDCVCLERRGKERTYKKVFRPPFLRLYHPDRFAENYVWRVSNECLIKVTC